MVVLLFFTTILFFSMEKTKCTEDIDNISESGVVDRLPAAEQLIKLMRNNSEVQNLIREKFIFEGGIFNKTGESTVYISIPPFRETVSKSDPTAWNNYTTGETYRIIIDVPNETVISIEKTDQLPDWIKQTSVDAVPYCL